VRPFFALLFALLLGLLASESLGQQVEISTEDRLRVTAQGDADVWLWSYPAGLDVEERGDTLLVDGPAGTYRLNVKGLTINWETQQFEQVFGSVEITLGPEPPGPGPTPPGPGPVPPGPAPEFDDEVSEAAYREALKLRLGESKAVAAVYRTAGRRLLGMDEPILRTIGEASEFIKEESASVGLDASWREWWSPLDSMWDDTVTNRESAGQFFLSLAEGLDAVSDSD